MSANLPPSADFSFLANAEATPVVVGTRAEQCILHEPVTCLMGIWQFYGLLAQQLAARYGILTSVDEPQAGHLTLLHCEGANHHLEQSILAHDFCGHLVRQDTTDEPAAVTLLRLTEATASARIALVILRAPNTSLRAATK